MNDIFFWEEWKRIGRNENEWDWERMEWSGKKIELLRTRCEKE